jgi:hypothetical protein
MPYTLSVKAEPVVVVELRGKLTDAELLAMTREVTVKMREHLRDGKHVAVVLDVSCADRIGPQQRKMMGEWRKEIRGLTEKVTLGMAMVVKSAAARGVFTALEWISPEPVELVYVSNLQAAFKWALARCDAAGVPVPSNVRQMAESA